MSIVENTDLDNLEYEIGKDDTGLAEIQKAMEEINKLQNQEVAEETQEVVDETSIEETEKETVGGEPEKKEDKLWKVKKGKYAALAAREALLKENAELKKMLSESLNSGTYHYGKSAFADLEKAKENKKRAIEDGDIDALIEADLALNKASNIVNDLDKWSYNDAQNKAPQVDNIEAPSDNLNLVEQEIAADWLENHTYLQPTSKNYNPKIANQVADFINYLDADIAKGGRQDEYFSDSYFDKIENYISGIKKEIPKNVKKDESESHIGSVRNSYSGPSNNKANSPTQMILTSDERRMCANAGISEKDWLRYKIEELKTGKKYE